MVQSIKRVSIQADGHFSTEKALRMYHTNENAFKHEEIHITVGGVNIIILQMWDLSHECIFALQDNNRLE